jgi:hypothetical protein
MIILEETAIAKKAINSAENTSFIASHDEAPSAGNNTNRNSRNNNSNTRGGRNGGREGRGRGRGSGRGGGRTQHRQAQWPSYPYQQQWTTPYPHPQQQWVGPWQPWATPPCPYPTAGNFHKQPKILGPKPQQAHVASAPTNPASQNASYSYALTDIQAAMHTFSISPPDDQWYMDTGATSHMTANGGNLTSYLNTSTNITVGSGHNIPVIGSGHASLPNPHNQLALKNVLHAPKLIKNLVSVRKFTIDNDVSVEFDPFGFSVKDFQTGMMLMRCNSLGDLYPVTTRPQTTASPPSTYAVLSNELWHNRLGHPVAPVLSSLHRNNFLILISFETICFVILALLESK